MIDMLSYGYLTLEDFKPLDQFPPDEVVWEAVADMMDRLLTPEDGGDNEAGKAVFRQIAAAACAQMEQTRPATKTKGTTES
jgi:TetR/AcrR family acrAB operon transcriptional repressor